MQPVSICQCPCTRAKRPLALATLAGIGDYHLSDRNVARLLADFFGLPLSLGYGARVRSVTDKATGKETLEFFKVAFGPYLY